jgi:hypothetical protein
MIANGAGIAQEGLIGVDRPAPDGDFIAVGLIKGCAIEANGYMIALNADGDAALEFGVVLADLGLIELKNLNGMGCTVQIVEMADGMIKNVTNGPGVNDGIGRGLGVILELPIYKVEAPVATIENVVYNLGNGAKYEHFGFV